MPMQRMNMRMCTAVVSSTCLPCSLATPFLIPLHGHTAPVHCGRCMKYTFPKHSPQEKVSKLPMRHKTHLINQINESENRLCSTFSNRKKGKERKDLIFINTKIIKCVMKLDFWRDQCSLLFMNRMRSRFI